MLSNQRGSRGRISRMCGTCRSHAACPFDSRPCSVNLATILFERGQLSEAVEMLKTAIVIDPWHSVAVKRLAEVEKAMDEDEPGFDDGDDGD